MDGQQPQIYEVWAFGEDDVTRKVHTTVQVDGGDVFVGNFLAYDLTPSWRRVPIIVINRRWDSNY